jgi:hypothetical protein
MKRNVWVFIFLVLAVLVAVPVKNIITAPNSQPINWQDKAFLYNMDFASRWAATILYPLGISTDPNQVIVGKHGWLFLGNMYDRTLSTDSRRASDIDQATAKNIEDATAAWNTYLSDQGVEIFRILVGPNKGTIYPENMPKWARPTSPNPTDALFSTDSGRYYIDVRPALLAEKQNQKEDLYFKTDTHWNKIGASIAFKYFADQISMVAPNLKWPETDLYDVSRIKPRNGGDLANFLRMSSSLSDVDPLIKVFDLPLTITQIDFDSGKVLSKGPNGIIQFSTKPLLVKSSGALNNKKVLWLRDSFGDSLSPLMAATFSDVIQLHWAEALTPGGSFARLVDEWQPDYVFVTVVERKARDAVFTLMPPTPKFVKKDERFIVDATSSLISTNQLNQGDSSNEYEINGDDAFVDFKLSKPVVPATAQYLNVDFSCLDGSRSVPIQIFWLADGMTSYDETHSARIELRTGRQLLNLHIVPNWAESASVSRMRIDVDPDTSCHRFQMSNPVLGVRN